MAGVPDDADPTPYRPGRPPPDELLRRARAYREHLDGRRSVRDVSSREVPREAIEEIARTASTAPSGANKQPWTFACIQDEDRKRRLREATEAQEREFHEERASEEWLDDLSHLGTDWRKPHLTDAPRVIVVFAQDHQLREDGSKGKHYDIDQSVGIAIGALLTAIRQAGLAALTHTPSPMDVLEDELDRPGNERADLVVPVGYPAGDRTVPDLERNGLDEVAVWHRPVRPPRTAKTPRARPPSCAS